MLKCRRGSFSLVFVSVVGFLATVVLTASAASGSAGTLAQQKCTRCHSYAVVKNKIEAQHPSERDWMMTIDKMKNAGLQITDEEKAKIAKYLAEQK